MKPFTVDDVRALLPELDALRPLMDRLIARAKPDRDRQWAGSGELGTVGGRLVDPSELSAEIPDVLRRVRSHLGKLYDHVIKALDALAREDMEEALTELLNAAEVEAGVGRFREADAFISAAIQLAHRIPDRQKVLRVYLTGARVARARGRWKEAEGRYGEALRLAEAAGDVEAAATAGVGLGNVAVDRGLWQEAANRYDRAETWVKRADRPLPHAWHLALNRCIVAREQGKLDEAEEALKRARDLAGEEGEKGDARAILENARGQLLQARGHIGEAEEAYRTAVRYARDPDSRVSMSLNLADVLLAKDRTLEAGEVAREAEEVAIRAGVIPRLPEVYRILGRVTAARGHSDAFVFFEKGREVIESRDLPEFERAQLLEAYGVHDLDRGEAEVGRARLVEARDIFEKLECDAARNRVARILQLQGDGPDPDGAPELAKGEE